jgi:hypothetical protein
MALISTPWRTRLGASADMDRALGAAMFLCAPSHSFAWFHLLNARRGKNVPQRRSCGGCIFFYLKVYHNPHFSVTDIFPIFSEVVQK